MPNLCGVDQAMLAQQLSELGLTASSLLGAVAETPKGSSRPVSIFVKPDEAVQVKSIFRVSHSSRCRFVVLFASPRHLIIFGAFVLFCLFVPSLFTFSFVSFTLYLF